MIKTKALEKIARFLKSKKISEVNFALQDNQGLFNTYKRGTKYEIRIVHDSTEIRVVETKARYL